MSRRRDCVIDAAVHAAIRTIHPEITCAEIQKRSEIFAGDGEYIVRLDGKCVALVTLQSERCFSLSLL